MEILTTKNNGKTIQKAILGKGKPLSEKPKNYIEIGLLHHNIGNDYNPSYLTLFHIKNKPNELRYEIYRNGSFYPYYGKFEYID
jgi:hypothetical protein